MAKSKIFPADKFKARIEKNNVLKNQDDSDYMPTYHEIRETYIKLVEQTKYLREIDLSLYNGIKQDGFDFFGITDPDGSRKPTLTHNSSGS